MSSEFRKIKIDALSDQLNDIVAGSPESDQGAKDGLQLKDNETANTGNALQKWVSKKRWLNMRLI